MFMHRLTLQEAEQARGVVIVIDVIRAFSVAAYAFAQGARRLWLVQTIDEAFALRQRQPDAILAGEVGGKLIPGFDLNNSPSRMAKEDVRDALIIQRTGAGTRGAVGASGASHLLLCSLVNAKATVAFALELLKSSEDTVTLLPTRDGRLPQDRHSPDPIEDDICADYLEALLLQRGSVRPTLFTPAVEVLSDGLLRLQNSGRLDVFGKGHEDLPAEDVPAFMAANCFSFAMAGRHLTWNGIRYVEVTRVDPDRQS